MVNNDISVATNSSYDNSATGLNWQAWANLEDLECLNYVNDDFIIMASSNFKIMKLLPSLVHTFL